jgi:hypothetical protein
MEIFDEFGVQEVQKGIADIAVILRFDKWVTLGSMGR